MKHFTINAENNITFHSSCREAKGTNGAVFSTEEQFADAIGNDNKRLLEIWNSLPGVKPVTKFANRKAATERIWKAIQNLGGPVATEPVPYSEAGAIKSDTAPTEAPPENGSTQAAPAMASPAPQATSGPAADQPNIGPEPKTQQDGATTVAEPEVVARVGAQVADVAPSAAKATKNPDEESARRRNQCQGCARGQQNQPSDRHDEAARRSHAETAHGCLWLAGTYRSRICCRRTHQEAGPHGRLDQARGR